MLRWEYSKDPDCCADGSDAGWLDEVSWAGDSDGDGIPDLWEQEYFGGPTNANPDAICLNGINTVRQAYVANLNPGDPAARYTLNFADPLMWNAASSRVYTIYWASNLLSGFQPFESGVIGGVFDDTVHDAEQSGFYRIGVQMEP